MSNDIDGSLVPNIERWHDLAPGVTYRLLRLHEKHGQFTLMIRAQPGSRLPRHRHEEPAEIYIIRGRGHHPQTGPFADGDYVYERKGAVHDEFEFGNDVLLLMLSHGSTSFLNPDDSIRYVLDVAMLKARESSR